MSPAGKSIHTCPPKIASILSYQSPNLMKSGAPAPVSSAGWNAKYTSPSMRSFIDINILAAPNKIAI